MKSTKSPKNDTKKNDSVSRIIFKNILSLVLLFVVIVGVNALFTGSETEKDTKITINQIAQDIQADTVSRIEVIANSIEVTYTDGTKKESKKEDQSSLTDTLVNLGVDKVKLSAIPYEVKTESGFGYWVGSIFPFLLPILFFFFIIWFFGRQMKGQGLSLIHI